MDQTFGTWFRRQCEEYQLSDQETATWLDLTVTNIQKMKVGNSPWPSLPSSMKEKIEERFGPYQPVTADPFEFREGVGTIYADEIDASLNLQKENSNGSEDYPDFAIIVGPVDYGGYTDFRCRHCGTPVPIRCNGQCPECGKLSDSAQ